MMPILMLALLIAVVMLWQRMRLLDERLVALERGADAGLLFVLDPVEPETPVPGRETGPWETPSPVLVTTDPDRESEPEPALEHGYEPRQEPQAYSVTADTPRPRAGLEDVFGRKLPIWAGGVALAVAGFLVVRYSIEAGLLSPAVRVLMGLIFGTALIGGAEAALRRAATVADERVRQALAGAGVATLYGSILAAANLYALVGPATAFVGLAAVTGLAGALSLRFGAPSAVLGLVGGLAAPALVGSSQPNVPLLAAYLALAIGGLTALGRQQRWWWLGAAALAGGFGWGTLLILSGVLDLADTMSIGAFTLALGVALPLLVSGTRGGAVRAFAALAGCAQLAALVAVGACF